MALKVGIIGCGGRGREHALGYGATDKAQIIAVADPVLESAQKLAEQYGAENVYSDYHEMLQNNQLDIVSVCTWTGQHRDQVIAAIENGARAIHCEKPMAPTYGESLEMHRAAVEKGVQLTFCHQRRFNPQFQKMRDLVQSGTIGELRRMEGRCSNLFDWATHWFDMFFFLNNETPAKSVLAQYELGEAKTVFGVPVDYQGISLIQFENGVEGYMQTGPDAHQHFWVRAEGSEGIIEARHCDNNELHVLKYGHDWEVVVAESQNIVSGDSPVYSNATVQSVLEAIDCLESGQEPRLSTHKALRATELIFASYESSRKGGRVDLPLQITDSPIIEKTEKLKTL